MLRKKVVMLGEMAVGKTSIVRRLVLGRFDGDYKGTLGHDIFVYAMSGLGAQHDRALELVIWDTDGGLGASAFHHDSAVKGAAAAIIVADVTRPRTLETMTMLVNGCDQHLPGRPIYLLFNKIDLLGDTPVYDIPADFKNTSQNIFKVSAMTGENVKDAFVDAANVILRRGL